MRRRGRAWTSIGDDGRRRAELWLLIYFVKLYVEGDRRYSYMPGNPLSGQRVTVLASASLI